MSEENRTRKKDTYERIDGTTDARSSRSRKGFSLIIISVNVVDLGDVDDVRIIATLGNASILEVMFHPSL
jgi:hypothetical protein